MQKQPTALNNISSLQPYRPGMPIEELARQYKLDPQEIIKLASNENPLGQSKKVAEVVQKFTQETSRYPDQYKLRRALSEFYDVPEENLVIGNGSNDILDIIARVFLGPNLDSISSEYGFIVYRLVTQLVGANNVIVPADNYSHDLDTMKASINSKTRVIWIANPNNPTGTFVNYSKILSFIKTVPSNIVIVLDEAYFEYLDDEQKMNAINWVKRYPNLVIVRTFSKIYGLAGLRIGYAISSPLVCELLNRVRQPFNVNSLAIEAGVAALSDQKFVAKTKKVNDEGMAQLETGLKKLSKFFIPSKGNFLTVKFDNPQYIHQKLLALGIIVRPLAEYGLSDFLRISVGKNEENEKLLEALSKIVDS